MTSEKNRLSHYSMVHVKNKEVSRKRDAACRPRAPTAQILDKGSLNVSRLKVWVSLVFFCRRSFSGDDDLDTLAGSTDRYEGERMIENELVLRGNDAELLGRALPEVKAKFYEESEMNLDDTQALDALLSSFRTVETENRRGDRPFEP